MTAFQTTTAAITTSPTLVVAADADFDRTVVLSPDNTNALVGFTTASGIALRQAINGSPNQPTEFALPAGQELYAWTASSTCNLGVLVTK